MTRRNIKQVLKNKRNIAVITIVSVAVVVAVIAVTVFLFSTSNNHFGDGLSGRYETTIEGRTLGLEFMDGNKIRLYDSRYDYVQTPTYTLDGTVLTFDSYDPITGEFIGTLTGLVSDDKREIAIIELQVVLVKK